MAFDHHRHVGKPRLVIRVVRCSIPDSQFGDGDLRKVAVERHSLLGEPDRKTEVGERSEDPFREQMNLGCDLVGRGIMVDW